MSHFINGYRKLPHEALVCSISRFYLSLFLPLIFGHGEVGSIPAKDHSCGFNANEINCFQELFNLSLLLFRAETFYEGLQQCFCHLDHIPFIDLLHIGFFVIANTDELGISPELEAPLECGMIQRLLVDSCAHPGVALNVCNLPSRFAKDVKGEAFMKNYHKMADLAPRDIVSRAIFRQMHKTNQPNVYLDMSHLETKFLKKRFPKISKKCKSFGLDIGRDLIPVRPAAHFAMGGIQTNIRTETNLKRLFACGEAACNGVHGANRLASNSLLEGLVFGKRAGISASLHAGRGYDAPEIKNFSPVRKWRKPEIAAVKKELKNLMEHKVGIIRCESSLKECLNKIKKWDEIFSGSLYNTQTMEMKNMLAVAGLVTDCALKRQESRGAHFRSDFPGLDDKKWKKPTTFALNLKVQGRKQQLKR